MPKHVNPRGGKTTNWGAGCGESGRPVRREGESQALPTPIKLFRHTGTGRSFGVRRLVAAFLSNYDCSDPRAEALAAVIGWLLQNGLLTESEQSPVVAALVLPFPHEHQLPAGHSNGVPTVQDPNDLCGVSGMASGIPDRKS